MVTFLDLLAIKKQLLVQANLRFQILVLQTFKSGSKIRLNTHTHAQKQQVLGEGENAVLITIVLISTATRDESLCVIANPAFVVYSSIVSFYVPFIITLLVYVQIYVVLRKRRKRVNTKPKQLVSQAADPDMATSLKVSCYSWLVFLWLHLHIYFTKAPLSFCTVLIF